MPLPHLPRWRTLAAATTLVLAACGGGSSDPVPPAASCDVPGLNAWLHNHMSEWYFWNELKSPPDPSGFTSLESYFDATLYEGGPVFPADRYSFYEPTARFNNFFEDGKTLGYGLFVAGLEVQGQPGAPLLVRYIEPQSDAAAQGLQRGDQIVSINGRLVSALIAADDFSELTPERAGQTLALVVRSGGIDRSVTLTASNYTLTPVTGQTIVSSPMGRKMGYVLVKDMIGQVDAPIEAAFAAFKRQGVEEVVLDLRYNGGGQIAVARNIASYVSAARTVGQDFARLKYNARRAARNDSTFRFGNPAAALGLSRVYMLTGPRTCSASELVVNGLTPFVDVVTIGDTSCGKPVGFLPTDQCGTTFSAVNFESVNSRDEGRFFDGLAPTCAAADDLSRPLGAPDEGLLAVARQHADTGSCPATATAAPTRRPLGVAGQGRRPPLDEGERRGMFVR